VRHSQPATALGVLPIIARLSYAVGMIDTAETYVVILCTAPDAEVGAELGRGLVDEQLAACVNIVPGVRSIYRWQGATKDDSEVQLLIKTRRGRFEAVAQWLGAHHPYTEPEIIALPILVGTASYLGWLHEQTSPH
jgi:periplasmic divalent cation tolerance protein